jgi:hypothetical protein
MPAFGSRALRTIAIATLLVMVAAPTVQAKAKPTFSQTLFRASAFSTQATKILCTAAVVQHIMNFGLGESRRDKDQQLELYAIGRDNNRYNYGTPGVDPQGVEVMLETGLHGTNWRVVTTRTLQQLLRRAARRMRETGLPVVLFVGGGRHVWTMNGYKSTADPASGGKFTVTHVRFSGPNFPKVKARNGWFDLRPNTIRSSERLSQALYPYREKLAFGEWRITSWRGFYVAVVPTLDEPDPDPTPTPEPTLEPSPEPTQESAPAQP